MSDTHFQVVMTGGVHPGFDAQTVVDGLTKLFRIAEDKARLLVQGRETIIKRDVDSGTAQKYAQAIQQAGASCRVESMAPTQPPPPPSAERDTGYNPRSSAPAELKAHPNPSPEADSKAPGRDDPYAPPAASLFTEPFYEVGEPHAPGKVGAGRGIGWLKDAIGMVFGAPITWVMMFVVYFVLSIVVSIVPMLGWLAASLFFPVITAGIMLGAHSQHEGDGIRLSHLFAGFKNELGPLVGVGAVYLGGTVVIGGVAMILMLALGANVAMLAHATEGGAGLDPAVVNTLVGSLSIVGLLSVALVIPLLMAIWFAPALIALHHRSLGEALKWSLSGCSRNWLAFLVYGIALLVLMAVVMGIVGASSILLGPFAMLPMVIVGLFLMPITFASIYVAYREIYLD